MAVLKRVQCNRNGFKVTGSLSGEATPAALLKGNELLKEIIPFNGGLHSERAMSSRKAKKDVT